MFSTVLVYAQSDIAEYKRTIITKKKLFKMYIHLLVTFVNETKLQYNYYLFYKPTVGKI